MNAQEKKLLEILAMLEESRASYSATAQAYAANGDVTGESICDGIVEAMTKVKLDISKIVYADDDYDDDEADEPAAAKINIEIHYCVAEDDIEVEDTEADTVLEAINNLKSQNLVDSDLWVGTTVTNSETGEEILQLTDG